MIGTRPFNRFNREFYHPVMLLFCKGGRLTGGTTGNDAVCTPIDLEFDQLFEFGFIKGFVIFEWCHKCDKGSFKTFFCLLTIRVVLW